MCRNWGRDSPALPGRRCAQPQSLTSHVLVTECGYCAWSSVLNSCCLLYLGRCFAFEFFPLALPLDLPLPASLSLVSSAFLVCSCLLLPSYPSPTWKPVAFEPGGAYLRFTAVNRDPVLAQDGLLSCSGPGRQALVATGQSRRLDFSQQTLAVGTAEAQKHPWDP